MGGMVGVDPVASTTACAARYRLSDPSLWLMLTSRSPVTVAQPRSSVIPAEATHSSCDASSQWEVKDVRRARTCRGSMVPVTASRAPATARAALRTVPGRRRALEGMQAQ